MQQAVGPAKLMTGILMGAETRDSHGKPFVLVVPDVSVYDPAMSDSLIPMGRLVEAGFTVNHRIPSQAKEDGFSLNQFPLYGGTIATPMPLTPTLRSLNRWPGSSSTRHTSLATILTLILCATCQTKPMNLPKTQQCCHRVPFLTTLPLLMTAPI